MRQTIELEVPSRALAPAVQDCVSRLHREQLVPLIERLCSEASPPLQLDRIERIELDLGELDARDFERELVARLAAALAEALRRDLCRQRARARHSGEEPAEVRAARELVSVFLATGTMPWWVDTREPRPLEDALRRLVHDSPLSLVAILGELATTPAAFERLAIVLDDGEVAELVERIAAVRRDVGTTDGPTTSSHGVHFRSLVTLLVGVAGSLGLSSSRLRTIAWHGVLRVVATGRWQAPAELHEQILTQVALRARVTYRALVGLVARRWRGRGAQRDEAEALEVMVQLHEALSAPQTQVGGIRDGKRRSSGSSEPERAPSSSKDERASDRHGPSRAPSSPVPASPRARAFDVSPFTATDEIYIDNAGLVLLWPFLAGFFKRLELLDDDGELRDDSARHRAVGLLDHLVTGTLTPLEYRVPLAKILCGIELAAVVDFGSPLSEDEVEECAGFLSAVIGHVPILGKMSVAGFRGTFLVRAGVLRSRDGAWLVQVERETYDVVLDQVPWAFDWIALPWMDTAVRVEWS